MSVSKDEKTGKWTVQCYYENWKGEKKHKKKRGFTTKKEALEWERDFLRSTSADLEMTLGAFVDIYFRDKAGELKDRTIKNKRYMIEVHILPYFANKRMNEITPADIIQWQNEIRAKGYAATYLRMVQNQLTALFTHASNIYNLKNNPCKKVKKMGKADADKLSFWTKAEYDTFIKRIDPDSRYYVILKYSSGRDVERAKCWRLQRMILILKITRSASQRPITEQVERTLLQHQRQSSRSE